MKNTANRKKRACVMALRIFEQTAISPVPQLPKAEL